MAKPKRPRKHLSLTTKLAAALLMIPQRDQNGELVLDGFGRPVPMIPFDEARLMTASQMVSLYEWDHSVLHSLGGPDHFAYLTPRLIMEHRAKSKRDRKVIQKINRAERKRAEQSAEMRLLNSAEALNAALDKLPKHAPDRRKAVIPGSKKSKFKRKLNGRTELRT